MQIHIHNSFAKLCFWCILIIKEVPIKIRSLFMYVTNLKRAESDMPKGQLMSKKRIYLVILLFMIGLTGFRISWIAYHQIPDHPHAEKGEVDLRKWKFTDNQTIILDGEWEFYRNEFLTSPPASSKPKEYIMVPGDWRKELQSTNSIASYGHGTYRLTIQLPQKNDRLYGIRLKQVMSASKVLLDGETVSEHNAPLESPTGKATKRGPYITLFHGENSEVELLVHVSNYDFPFKGGITGSVKIGTAEAILKESKRSVTLQIAVSII